MSRTETDDRRANGSRDGVAAEPENGLWATPLDRLLTLCDPGTFRPLCTQAISRRMSDRGVVGDGVLVGWGEVEGRPICCYAQDSSFLGGSLGEAQANSVLRLLRIARRSRVPVVAVVESAGARLHEGLPALVGYGRIFRETVRLSASVPQVSVIGGTSAGGGCYSPALTDVVVMTKQARMFLTGPAVVREAVGEQVDDESLGGPRVHDRNGVADVVADDMPAALAIARELVNLLREPEALLPRRISSEADNPPREVRVPADASKPYDVRGIIRTLVDRGRFLELSPRWARNIVTGFARIDGRTVGVVANQPAHLGGLLDVPACEKGASFVGLCDRLAVPLLVLVDTPGFLPGTSQERAGVIRHGAALVRAFAGATVPRVTLVVRKAYGGAFIAMNSKELGADLVLAWPQVEIGIMGARPAVEIVHRRTLAEDGGPEVVEALMRSYAESNLRPSLAAGCGVVDEIVEPQHTRTYLRSALGVLRPQGRRAPEGPRLVEREP